MYANYASYGHFTRQKKHALLTAVFAVLWQDTDIGTESSAAVYSYSVRIIPPKSKDLLVLDMHSTTQWFQTQLELKKKIHESCKSCSL